MSSLLIRFPLRQNLGFFNQAERLHSRFFTVFYQAQSQPQLQVAVIVGKNTSRLAVERHQLKRWILASLQSFAPRLTPQTLVIKTNPSARQLDFPQLKTELEQLLKNRLDK